MAAPNQSPKSAIQLSFLGGMNSQIDPLLLPEGTYKYGLNVLNRTGCISVRPGHDWIISFPKPPSETQSNAQGMTLFKTFDGRDFLVAVVDGIIFYSETPFREWKHLTARLRGDVKQAYFCQCEASVTTNEDGSIAIVDPYRLLVIQDGAGRAVVWNGTQEARTERIPIGAAMAWSGNRLWVANGAQLYASDIGDPTSFLESEYIGMGGSFQLPYRITAMHEAPSVDGALIVFTEATTHVVQAGVRDRTLWPTTPDFIACLSTSLGCAAPRSVVQQYGLLWWMTRDGLVNLDIAKNSRQSSRINYFDAEMDASKRLLLPNYEGACCGVFGEFLFVSVPYCSAKNKHTWVLDAAPAVKVGVDKTSDISQEAAPSVWASVWEGTNPTAWVSGLVAGKTSVYHLSLGDDGIASVWQSFTDSEDDNGVPIQWAIETRAMASDGFAKIEPKAVDFRLTNIRGPLTVGAYIAPAHRMGYRNIFLGSTQASVDNMTADSVFPAVPGTEFTTASVFRSQLGHFRSPRSTQPRSTMDIRCDPQTGITGERDYGYSLLFTGIGHCVFAGFRMLYLPESEVLEGRCDTFGSTATVIAGDGTPGDTLSNPVFTFPVSYTDLQTQVVVQTELVASSILPGEAEKLAASVGKAIADAKYANANALDVDKRIVHYPSV